jgi:hypothetical protein
MKIIYILCGLGTLVYFALAPWAVRTLAHVGGGC